MKKSSILIAMIAVIAAAPAAKAEGPQIDFNGNNSAVMEIGAVIRGNMKYSVPVPEAQQDDTFALLNEEVVNGVIKGAVEACANEGKADLKTDLGNLLKHGTIKEKASFVYNKGDAYVFPAGIVGRRFKPDNAVASTQKRLATKSQTCFASHEVRVCSQRKVCRLACAAAAGGAGSIVGGSVGGGGLQRRDSLRPVGDGPRYRWGDGVVTGSISHYCIQPAALLN